MLRGDQRASDSRDEPPFVDVGDVAHELHGSMRDALFKGDKRPVAAPPQSHDDHGFDPWYYCLLIAHPEARCDLHRLMMLGLATARVGEVEDYQNGATLNLGAYEEYIVQGLQDMTIQQEAEYQSDIEEYCSQSGDIRPESTYNIDSRVPTVTKDLKEGSAQKAMDPDRVSDCSRCVCEYLYMVEHNALGLTSDSQKTFLTETNDRESPGLIPTGGTSTKACSALQVLWSTRHNRSLREPSTPIKTLFTALEVLLSRAPVSVQPRLQGLPSGL
ncbi:Hypothetical protein SMAX5B_001513 [Scophthalmus maximus]|uniref:Uncharacterized protein n=1 Tax=Scophthalmus maximus TaxID=52904 RepID=A0A2U9B3J5_SCOMX|nr:Hypothetical protein SMAX5B_001513 [Scophthalmus maximus]